ncbi:hypothetical protein DL766_001500 [Monosporascus sp. MC13-8B]|uniref:Uncharacterized protein n=1 Tax=Monosporascus cannonballus TaxID=155416 RepID=A0ABY0GWF8_9PEZI|nr:hypothetical protein DL762_008689 [Monosporascus cannonballus]RYO99837.1 hypothetical protein DL763_001227 [Monosporascus cannonballus]RYP37506.1 hypothetical protein DL766_001500 [Monosporascus sp. MC13-8B]
MQRYGDDDPLLRPIQRRETTPARMMGQPLPPPRQPMNSFGRRASPPPPPQPVIRDGAQMPACYAPYYPGASPQAVPMYYQPHPVQFISVRPQPGTPEPSLMGFSGVPMPGVLLFPIDSSLAGASRSRSGRRTSVGSKGSFRSKARSRSSSPGSRIYADNAIHGPNVPSNRERSRSPSPSPVRKDRRGRYDDYEDDLDIRVTRRRAIMEYVPGADRFEDTAPSTVYSFTPSRMSRAASTQPSTHADNEPSEKDEEDANGGGGGARKEIDYAPRLSYVFESQYSGDHTLGGSHGVKLTANEATRVPDLTTAEQKGIRDLLARVQRKFVKTVQTANGRSVRHMEPACIQHVLPPNSTSKAPDFARRTVTWVCLPYFTLEKYSGLQGAAENSSAFPIETLLQAKFSRAGRERDMRQAVCQSNQTPTGLCFHVAQIWCLVVGNSFLFTYSRMTEEALRGDFIGLSVKSIKEISDAKPRIAISYGQSVLWSIPVEECHTWLDFLSHFREFWPRRLQFFRRKRPVTADNWPRVWNIARHVNDKIMLEMRIGTAPEPPPAGILISKNVDQGVEGDATSGSQSQSPPQLEDLPGPSNAASAKLSPGRKSRGTPGNPKSTAPSTLHIFSCLVGVTHPDFDTIDEEALDDHLREVEDYLLSRTSFSDRRAYDACPEATRDEICAHLEKEGIELSKRTDVQRGRQRDYEARLDIFNAADVVFKFFFPPNVEVPTVRKFWGALRVIITDGRPVASIEGDALQRTAGPLISKYTIRNIRSELRSLCVELQAFNEIFTQSGRHEQAKIAVPKEIVEGWIHLLMGLVYLPKDYDKSDPLVDDAKILIHSGMAAVVRSLSDKSLLDSSVILPLELLSLLSLKLLQDVTVGMPNISECYSACLDVMEANIASKPSDRSREYRISLLMEEISVVQRIIDAQTSVFQSLLSFAPETGRGEGPGVLDEPSRGTYLTPVHHTDSRHRSKESSDTIYYARESTRPRMRSDYREGPTEHSSYDPSSSQIRSRARSYEREEPTAYYYDEILTYVAANPPTDFKLASTDPGGYRVLLLNECLQFLAGRERDFSGFRGWASFLEKVNRNKIDTTKDRHDNAIYAFTIVTVIFLPLSAVASIFGMNTRDVRDMDLDQWAYWAAAVPVTAVVVFLGLLWTGELGNIVRWIQSFSPRRQGYQSLPDDLYYDDYRPPPPPPPPVRQRGYPEELVVEANSERKKGRDDDDIRPTLSGLDHAEPREWLTGLAH